MAVSFENSRKATGEIAERSRHLTRYGESRNER